VTLSLELSSMLSSYLLVRMLRSLLKPELITLIITIIIHLDNVCDAVILRVHPVHLMNVEQRHANQLGP